ncbi:hypothetical protein [Luteibacter sp. 22Crub2.1]|uniref:hypothetical protein n=1 Tax=Luteibacter sp. 22Crub2.1 TaxID=1283288 RepID=UPI0009A736A5|nr:hypothetical protein [Luteibacter sp. 22Crub2.1]SKB33022.1 Metal-dependent hydrolase, beta-lactamase superfamily II [Luteibacter sp. 22Crub2.1]
MNPYFVRGEGWREIPKRIYARIEYIEQSSDDAGMYVVGFDAVDADLPGFGRDFFELTTALERTDQIRAYWRSSFDRESEEADGFFDRLPMFHLEATMPVDWNSVARWQTTNSWIELSLDHKGSFPVDVFGGLFEEATVRRATEKRMLPDRRRALNALFNMRFWPGSSGALIRKAMTRSCHIDQLRVFDIGQGSANALCCECGYVMYYFDAGCGVYRNKNTNPPSIEFCICDKPVVILSHWDADHWAGALEDKDLLAMTWIAPRQKIGVRHVAFAKEILNAGGQILITSASGAWKVTSKSKQTLILKRCTGPASDRNRSGLALTVEDKSSGRGWLLTGDAPYDVIPGPLPPNLSAVVVPHHGGNMGKQSVAMVAPAVGTYGRLVYSFGPDNAHGSTGARHPTSATVNLHASAGWIHTGWNQSTPGSPTSGSSVMSTATHGGKHFGGIAIGWDAPPSAHGSCCRCNKSMPITQA